jgi:hypothetical protein
VVVEPLGAGGTSLPWPAPPAVVVVGGGGVVVVGVVVAGVVVAGFVLVCGGAVFAGTCGVNGFFVWKTVNDTSWPAAAGGRTSVFASPLEDALVEAAPAETFGSELPAPVELEAVELGGGGGVEGFIIFIVFGTS